MISIIIPTYKRNENLARAIESVLNQTGDFELIVVDDNDPNTEYRNKNEQAVKKYLNNTNFTYLKHNKNKNGAAARNTGIKHAKGEYITFLDDDDEFVENRIEKLEEVIRKEHPDFIYTGVIIIKKGVIEKKVIPNINKQFKELQLNLLNQKSFFGTGSNIVCKKTIVEKIKGFDENFARNQDIEFVIRVLEHSNKIKCIDEALVIKNVDGYMNVPPINIMIETKEKFLEKFSYIINKLSSKERKEVLNNNYSELLKIAYLKNNKTDIKKCRQYLKSINHYSLINDIKIKLKYKIKKFYITKKIRSWIKI